MSDVLEIRVIGAPDVAGQAVARFAALLDVDRCAGPYPSRKTAGLVLFYLSGRLRPVPAADAPADLEV